MSNTAYDTEASKTAADIAPLSQSRVTFRAFIAAAIGIVTAIATHIGFGYFLKNKLIPFESEVSKRTREDIMQRLNAGGVGAAFDAQDIRKFHRLSLIQTGDHKLAKFVYNLGGEGGFTAAVAGVAGAIAALPVGIYGLFKSIREENQYNEAVKNARLTESNSVDIQQDEEVLKHTMRPGRQHTKDVNSKSMDPESIMQRGDPQTMQPSR